MKQQHTNRLIRESSPYLLQHAHNPVDWYPWGDEALEKAGKDNRLMVISIGYSACHWCHVMEKESFTKTEVAEKMNENYISVKVDREERPDVDQVYMQAAYLVTGSGGWPLNVIALPDGSPVYAGTYFPRDKWLHVLDYFAGLQENQPELLLNQAKNLRENMAPALPDPVTVAETKWNTADIETISKSILQQLDTENGGLAGAPKFPMPVVFDLLTEANSLLGNSPVQEGIDTSLNAMAAGGIYDQLGGGFCRYSTDAEWKVPHFEKMLYDNAQLISLYAKAYRQSGNKDHARIVEESIAFAERELLDKSGGFYAALDADSEGEEGKYYVWTKDEIRDIAGDDAEAFCRHFNILEEGNWEGRGNILYRDPENTGSSDFSSLREKLLHQRSKRIAPGLDDKILTSWNALMISGLTDAFMALGKEEYLERARKTAAFIEKNLMRDDHGLWRNYKAGKASINAFLDDYAFLAEALIGLYTASLNEHYLYLSGKIADYAVKHFYDPEKAIFYYTSSSDKDLVFRPSEVSDNVIPSSSSAMAGVLFVLSRYFDHAEYREIAEKMLLNFRGQILRHPSFHAGWAKQLLRISLPAIEVVVMGPAAISVSRELNKHYFPLILLSGAEKRGTLPHFGYKYNEGTTMIYVCRDGSCRQPVDNVQDALGQLQELEDEIRGLLPLSN